MVEILGAVLSDGIAPVEAACAEALDAELASSDVILNILARRRQPAAAATVLMPDALRLRHEPKPIAPATTACTSWRCCTT